MKRSLRGRPNHDRPDRLAELHRYEPDMKSRICNFSSVFYNYMLKLNYILFHMTSAFTLHFFRVLHFQSWWRQRKPSVRQSWTWDQMRCVDPLKESVFREENPALLHWCRISCLRNTRVSSWCGNIWMRWTQIQLLSNVFFIAIIQLHDGVIFVYGWRLFPRVHYVVSFHNMNS